MIDADATGPAERLTRGVRRALVERGYASLTEFRLTTGRRADILAVNDAGEIVIVEVKSSVADFRADRKWPEYQPWCDGFYFAVGTGFPADLIPDDCGLMIADEFGAAVLREAPVVRLNPARRRALVLRLALAAAGRLHRLEDPMLPLAVGAVDAV
jgi:hypothetical protein